MDGWMDTMSASSFVVVVGEKVARMGCSWRVLLATTAARTKESVFLFRKKKMTR